MTTSFSSGRLRRTQADTRALLPRHAFKYDVPAAHEISLVCSSRPTTPLSSLPQLIARATFALHTSNVGCTVGTCLYLCLAAPRPWMRLTLTSGRLSTSRGSKGQAARAGCGNTSYPETTTRGEEKWIHGHGQPVESSLVLLEKTTELGK